MGVWRSSRTQAQWPGHFAVSGQSRRRRGMRSWDDASTSRSNSGLLGLLGKSVSRTAKSAVRTTARMEQNPVHTKRLEDNMSNRMQATEQGQQDRALKRAKSDESADEAGAKPSVAIISQTSNHGANPTNQTDGNDAQMRDPRGRQAELMIWCGDSRLVVSSPRQSHQVGMTTMWSLR